jgi:hypothetical protein
MCTVRDSFICYFSLIHDGEALGCTKLFLPFMCRLRSFEIHANLAYATEYDYEILSFLMGSLFISLTSPATLEHLKLNIWFWGSPYGFDINSRFYYKLRVADAWRHLDSIPYHPTGSRLQRVDITIRFSHMYFDFHESYEPNDNEVLEALLDGLPLLRRKGILFATAYGT